MGFGVWGLGFGVWGLRLKVYRAEGLGDSRFRFEGLRLRGVLGAVVQGQNPRSGRPSWDLRSETWLEAFDWSLSRRNRQGNCSTASVPRLAQMATLLDESTRYSCEPAIPEPYSPKTPKPQSPKTLKPSTLFGQASNPRSRAVQQSGPGCIGTPSPAKKAAPKPLEP